MIIMSKIGSSKINLSIILGRLDHQHFSLECPIWVFESIDMYVEATCFYFKLIDIVKTDPIQNWVIYHLVHFTNQ